MADGFRVVCSTQISGQTYSVEAAVTLAQMGDPATRAKIRRWMQHQLIEGIVSSIGDGIKFEATRSLDVTGFQPDAQITGAERESQLRPPVV